MYSNRIKELRESNSMSQSALGLLLGVTQQTISSMERGNRGIPSDILCTIAQTFNVTADYILGISSVERNEAGEARMKQELEQYYGIVQRCQRLDVVDQRTVAVFLDRLVQAKQERMQEREEERENTEGSSI